MPKRLTRFTLVAAVVASLLALATPSPLAQARDQHEADDKERPISDVPSNKIVVPPEIGPEVGPSSDPTFSVPLTIYAGYENQLRLGGFTEVEGEWVQPRAKCSQDDEGSWAYFWVGLHGNSTLEQIGTGIHCSNGNADYFPWWQLVGRSEAEGGEALQGIRPSPPPAGCEGGALKQPIPANCLLPVKPGDKMRAEVSFEGNNTFELVLANATRNWQFETLQTFTDAELDLASWIAEAPSGDLTEFATGGKPVVNFSNCAANEDPISRAGLVVWKESMLSLPINLPVRAEPSDLSSDGNAFSVTWQRH